MGHFSVNTHLGFCDWHWTLFDLRYEVWMTPRASNVGWLRYRKLLWNNYVSAGFGWWSHDIGGWVVVRVSLIILYMWSCTTAFPEDPLILLGTQRPQNYFSAGYSLLYTLQLCVRLSAIVSIVNLVTKWHKRNTLSILWSAHMDMEWILFPTCLT